MSLAKLLIFKVYMDVDFYKIMLKIKVKRESYIKCFVYSNVPTKSV